MAFDPLGTGKRDRKNFDSIFGSGSYDEGTEWARRIGTGIGQAKLKKKLREQAEAEAERERKKQEKLLEQAAKEAAKKERERAEKESKEKKSGRKESELSKQIDDKKRRLKDAGISSEKKQSAFGKKMNLDPDQNWFMDGLELLSRPTKAVIGSMSDDAKRLKEMQENTKEAKKKLKAGKISEKEFDKILGGKGTKDVSWKDRLEDAKDAFMGEKKTSGSKLLNERYGMKKGVARGVAGFGLEVALDPLNLVGALPAKAASALSKTKAVTKTAKAVREAPIIKPTADAFNDIFSGSRKMTQSLQGGTTDALKNLTRSLENRRLSMQDRSTDAIANAMMKAGKNNGDAVGKAMEAPLRFGKGPDLSAAPNVLNSSLLKEAFPSTSTVGRLSSQAVNTTFRPTEQILSNGIKPNIQQKLDWGSKGLLPSKADSFLDAGVYGEWGTKPPPEIVAEVKQVIGNIKEPAAAAETLLKQPAIRAKYRQAANTLIESNADVRKFAQENGIEVSDLEGYMAHFATKEAQKHLDNVGTASSSGKATVGGDKRVNKRKIQDSVTNANIKMKKTTGVDEFFTPDAFLATAGGQQRMINFIAAESMKKNVIANPQLAREIPSGTKARKGFVHMDIDGKRYEMTKGAAEGITNFEKHVTDEGVHVLLKGLDTVQSAWKKTALFSAGFHVRNFVGNSWNMYVSGMRPDEIVTGLKDGLKVFRVRAARAGKDVKANPTLSKHYDAYVSQGLRGSGQMADFSKDAAASVMADARAKTKGTLGMMSHDFTEILKADGVGGKLKAAVNAPFDQSRRLGDEADEVARFALFNHHMKAGKSAEEAAAKVREVLFDYSALTKAENEVFRRAMPFYTFMRKNAEFQMKSFMKSPEKYNRLMQAKDNAYANADANEDITPDYLKDGFAVPLPGTDRMLNLNLPAADLNKLTNPGKMALDAVTPLAKLPAELALNKQFLNGAPIEQFEGQTGNLLGMEVPKKLEHSVKSLVSPARNISGVMDESMKDASMADKIAQAVGGNVAKRYDQESFQNQADFTENTRLGDLIKKAEKQDGKTVKTLAEMKKEGKATTDQEEEDQKFLKEAGYKGKQRDLLLALKKKVYDGNEETSLQVRSILEEMGIEEEVIQMITSDYLEY